MRDLTAASFRVMTYNVHGCRGVDRAWSPERVATVIASCHPDIVALQELDVGRARSGHIDQAEVIARDLGMDVQFFPALRVMDELYGDAILSRWPARTVKSAALPGLRFPGLEPRGAIWSEIQADGMSVQVINTHLSLGSARRACLCLADAVCRRHADPSARSWPRPHQDRPTVGLCPRRSAVVRP